MVSGVAVSRLSTLLDAIVVILASFYICFLLLAFQGEVAVLPLLALSGGLAGALLWLLRCGAPVAHTQGPHTQTCRSHWAWLLGSLWLSALAALTLLGPLWDWDARILWGLKAKLLTETFSLQTEAFTDPYRLHLHPRYPLLFPTLLSLWTRLWGAYTETAHQGLVLLMAFGAWGAFVRLTRALGFYGGRSVMASTLLLSSGVFIQSVFYSRVEVALLFFCTLSLTYAAELLKGPQVAAQPEGPEPHSEQGRTRSAILMALSLALASHTKNEGMLWSLCAILSLAGLGGRRLGAKSLRDLAVLVGVYAVALLPWQFHVARIPNVADEQYLERLTWGNIVTGLERLPEILLYTLDHISTFSLWHVLWLLPLVGGPYWRAAPDSKRPLLQHLGLVGALYILGLLFIYVLSPWRDISRHMGVSFDRITLPLLPILILWGLALLFAHIFKSQCLQTPAPDEGKKLPASQILDDDEAS